MNSSVNWALEQQCEVGDGGYSDASGFDAGDEFSDAPVISLHDYVESRFAAMRAVLDELDATAIAEMLSQTTAGEVRKTFVRVLPDAFGLILAASHLRPREGKPVDTESIKRGARNAEAYCPTGDLVFRRALNDAVVVRNLHGLLPKAFFRSDEARPLLNQMLASAFMARAVARGADMAGEQPMEAREEVLTGLEWLSCAMLHRAVDALEKAGVRRGLVPEDLVAWDRPCPAMFNYVAGRYPSLLEHYINCGAISRGMRSMAAEAAGIASVEEAKELLFPVLSAPELDPLVAEGAVLGLAKHTDDDTVRQFLADLNERVQPGGLRETLRDVLDDC